MKGLAENLIFVVSYLAVFYLERRVVHLSPLFPLISVVSGGMNENQQIVLIVEDNTELRSMYSEWLSRAYQVRGAGTATSALEQFDEFVDVVLLDRHLPDRNGSELLTEIRTRRGQCRVAMVTGIKPDFDLLEMDFDAYVTKPVRESDLVDLVDSLCSFQELQLAQEGEIII